MNSKFSFAVHARDEVTYVKLAGVIDEDNELGGLAEKLHAGTAVIDVGEIERINSCGVRDWVNWLGKAESGGARVVLIECSPAIVAQINLVNNFTGQGVVKSFYAPYFCPSCDLEKVLLVETRDMVGHHPFKAPSCRCDECDGPMDFDDMEESYFAFLGNNKKVVTDERVDDVLNEFTPPSDVRKIRGKGTTTGPGSPGSSGKNNGVVSSLPSVPSLPGSRNTPPGTNSGTMSSVSGATPSGFTRTTDSGAGRTSAAAALAELEQRRLQSGVVAVSSPHKGNYLWLALIGVLLGMVVYLGFILFRH